MDEVDQAGIATDLENLRHMVGVGKHTPRNRWGYRNYFAAGQDDTASMERLVAYGLAVRGKPFDEYNHYYHATVAGGVVAGLSARRAIVACWAPGEIL